MTAQIYCDALDKYLYYFDRGTPAVRPPLSALFTTQDTILTRTRTRTDCTEIHRVARRAHHVVHRYHLCLVLVVPPPVAADRRDRVPRDDPTSFPKHIAAYLWQEDVRESGAVCRGGGGGRVFEDGDHAVARGGGRGCCFFFFFIQHILSRPRCIRRHFRNTLRYIHMKK